MKVDHRSKRGIEGWLEDAIPTWMTPRYVDVLMVVVILLSVPLILVNAWVGLVSCGVCVFVVLKANKVVHRRYGMEVQPLSRRRLEPGAWLNETEKRVLLTIGILVGLVALPVILYVFGIILFPLGLLALIVYTVWRITE